MRVWCLLCDPTNMFFAGLAESSLWWVGESLLWEKLPLFCYFGDDRRNEVSCWVLVGMCSIRVTSVVGSIPAMDIESSIFNILLLCDKVLKNLLRDHSHAIGGGPLPVGDDMRITLYTCLWWCWLGIYHMPIVYSSHAALLHSSYKLYSKH